MIEMVVPSALDPSVAPPGCHVALLFTQYAPPVRADGRPWDTQAAEEYAAKVGGGGGFQHRNGYQYYI